MPNYDVQIGSTSDTGGTIGLMLYEETRSGKRLPKHIPSYWAPADPARAGSAPEDETWSDWKNGFGYSQPGIVNDGYQYFLNVDPRSPGMLMPAGAITEITTSGLGVTLGEITDSFSIGGDYYLLAGRYAVKILSGHSTVSTSTDLGSGVTFDKAVLARHSGTTYAWAGRSGGFSRFDGTTWTQTTSFSRGKIASVYWTTSDGVSVQRLVATDTVRSIVHCPLSTDPMTAGNWSASITVGEGAYSIGALTGAARHVYISTTGGVYDLDDLLETVALTPYYQDQLDDNNGLASYFWKSQSAAYVLYGAANGIDAVDVSQEMVSQNAASWALPGAALGIPNETPIWGRPTAWASDSGWVVCALWNGTDSYIIYGKPRADLGWDGPGEWVWHGAFAQYTNQKVTHLKPRTVNQSGVLSRRLWTATVPSDGSAGTRLFWQSLPTAPTARQDDDIGGAHTFATSSTLIFTPRDWREPSRQKTAIRADGASRDLAGGTHTLTLYVGEDSNDTFGDPIGVLNTSPKQEVGISDNAPQGLQLTPKLVAAGTAATPWTLLALTIRAAIDRELVEIFELDCWLENEQQLGYGGNAPQNDPEVTYARLKLKQNAVTSFKHPNGRTYTVLFEPTLRSDLVEIEQDHEPSQRSYGRRMTFSLRVLDEQAQFDLGLYDLDHYGSA